ncbi:hypothetical protein FF38_01258 [Lucilia cuprina]|uniref:Uncharacterized protein n=1 Tax=Lucilia cuprina TaxID=7375 RepID=A0A0L0BMG1_LUCCU|nr:hypothetical protein FF38_01258 [Lucilia cuprina]
MHDQKILNLPVQDQEGYIIGIVDVLLLTSETLTKLNQLSKMNSNSETQPEWNQFLLSMNDIMGEENTVVFDTSAQISDTELAEFSLPEGLAQSYNNDITENSFSNLNSHSNSFFEPIDSFESVLPEDSASQFEKSQILSDSSFIFKLRTPNQKTHRFPVRLVTSINNFRSLVLSKLSEQEIQFLGGSNEVKINYVDEEGDVISITCEQDIHEATNSAQRANQDESNPTNIPESPHHGDNDQNNQNEEVNNAENEPEDDIDYENEFRAAETADTNGPTAEDEAEAMAISFSGTTDPNSAGNQSGLEIISTNACKLITNMQSLHVLNITQSVPNHIAEKVITILNGHEKVILGAKSRYSQRTESTNHDMAESVDLDLASASASYGYSTCDDIDCSGDDTIHKPWRFHHIPNVIQSVQRVKADPEANSTLIFHDFMTSFIVEALGELEFSHFEVFIHGGETITELFTKYFNS